MWKTYLSLKKLKIINNILDTCNVNELYEAAIKAWASESQITSVNPEKFPGSMSIGHFTQV